MNNSSELAWAAGFFDGEGTTSIAKATNGRHRTKPKLTVSQKHPECLTRFKQAIGDLGKIYGPLHYKDQTIYHYSIQNAKGVDTVLTLLWPFLSVHKRNQAETAGFKFGTIRCPKIGRPKKEQQ